MTRYEGVVVNPDPTDHLNDEAMRLVENARSLPNAENCEALDAFRTHSAAHAAAVDWAEGYLDLLLRMAPAPFSRSEYRRIRWEARWARLREPPRAHRAAAVLLLVTVMAAVLFQPNGTRETPTLAEVAAAPEPLDYSSGRKHRKIVLEDGSTLWLDWHSHATVSYERDERRVALLKGRAAFLVTADANRPFFVIAGALETRVTGTEFLVDRRRPDRVEVAVLEGSVRVTAGAEQLELGASDLARLKVSRLSLESLDDGTGTGAWRDGKLVLRDVALLEALRTLEPYSAFKIDGSRLGDMPARISGTYFVDRADDAIRGLIQTHRLEVEQEGSVLLLRPARPARPSFR
ncbi:MAG: FecR domain-containing protein [Pseudomonadota bacterium]